MTDDIPLHQVLLRGWGGSDTGCVVATGAVHMVGGVAGLAGAWVAGPRLGRFDSNGKPQPIHGHNAVYYTMGVQPCPLLS